ncbi:MAG: alpha-amylase family protein [Candidatus Dormibacteraeota bacterium]|nr:alpha-amylase family protein [Candidatus Dormibacteraeota bacterium]
MAERWYKRAVIYSVEVDAFQDSNGDGVGDLRGLISRLDYIAGLGATYIWLNPIHPTPGKDDGYDGTDYYQVDPRLGTLGDFVDLIDAANDRGLRVMLDLVINHTSDQHPWFQASRRSRDSSLRDWYVWSDEEPAHKDEGAAFPGEQHGTWTKDRRAKAWYFHRFYDFEPSLNHANPAVWDEIRRIVTFWLHLGVAGFRMDAAPFSIEHPDPRTGSASRDYDRLRDIRRWLSWTQGDAIVLAEANVPDDEILRYVSSGHDNDDRLHVLFNFRLNARIALALARRDVRPIVWALDTAPQLPENAQWATFIRNHDEEDLSQLTDEERDEVFAAFAPEESMRLYGRGIRRRLAPMLGGDRRWLELAYSLQFTLPGTPILRYGQEIGMGEDLRLKQRDAIRTPMQWSDAINAGFSTAPADRLIRPVIAEGDFDYRRINVAAQRRDESSLLLWMSRLLRTLRECPEIGDSSCDVLETGIPSVLMHRFTGPHGAMLFLHNVADIPRTVDVTRALTAEDAPSESFADDDYGALPQPLVTLPINGYGYRWIRLRFVP